MSPALRETFFSICVSGDSNEGAAAKLGCSNVALRRRIADIHKVIFATLEEMAD